MNDICIEKINRPIYQNIARSILAGIYIGFGCLFMILVKSDLILREPWISILSGIAFSIGLFCVFVGKGELFTGNCTLVIGLINKKIPIYKTIDTMILNFIGNALGVGLVCLLIFNKPQSINVAKAISIVKFSKNYLNLFISSIACNVLVCTSVWLNTKSKSIIDSFIVALLPVTLFVAFGFEHSIADIFFLIFSDPLIMYPEMILATLSIITIGNVIGGVLISILFNYAENRV